MIPLAQASLLQLHHLCPSSGRVMRKNYLLFVTVTLLLAGCGSVAKVATSEHRDWSFIESVGGLEIVGQDKNPHYLRINCDVSGTRKITCNPTAINSALAVRKIGKRINENVVQIYIVTSVITEDLSSSAHGVNLGSIDKGKYEIQYLNPDNSVVTLGEIQWN